VDDVTDGTFADEVLASAEPVVVDFWAPWCKPCDAIEPHLRAIEEERGLRIVRLNVDSSLAVPSRYGVLALPTVILFAGGEPRVTVYGAHARNHYELAFASFLD
jgi:thioredoxin 1